MKTFSSSPKLLSLFTLICIFSACECIFSFPWGPYVVPRSGKRADIPPYHGLVESECCPPGLKSRLIRGHSADGIKFACPLQAPCCPGLKQVTRISQSGRHLYACVKDMYMEISGAGKDGKSFARLLEKMTHMNGRDRK